MYAQKCKFKRTGELFDVIRWKFGEQGGSMPDLAILKGKNGKPAAIGKSSWKVVDQVDYELV